MQFRYLSNDNTNQQFVYNLLLIFCQFAFVLGFRSIGFCFLFCSYF